MPLLDAGDQFPTLTVHLTDGKDLVLPEDLSGQYAVVLFNRGSWCPYCQTQLRAFQRARDALSAVGASVVSLSVDDQATAHKLVSDFGIEFPVGHSADAHELARLTGAFVNTDPLYVQATGFVLDPEGRVLVSTYSSGAIGRLTPDDVIGLIKYIKEHARG